MPEIDTELIQKLSSVVDKRKADGTHFYSAEDVRNFIPHALFAMGLGDQWDALPPSLQQVIVEWAQAAGVTEKTKPQDVEKKLSAHRAKNPPNRTLWKEYAGAIHMHGKGSQSDGYAAR